MKDLFIFHFKILVFFALFFSESYSFAQVKKQTSSEIIEEQNSSLKQKEDSLRELTKQVRQLNNDKIGLNVDMKKQGYKFISLNEEAKRRKLFLSLLGLFLLLTTAFIFILVRTSRSKQKYLDLLEKEKAQVSFQKELVSVQKEQTEKALLNLKDSIRYAMRIQKAVLTDPARIKNMLDSDFFIIFKPKDIVSGDFYFVEKKEDWFIAAVADCTGHGVPGALLSMLAITMLNDIVLKAENMQANEILNDLREKMVLAMKHNDLLNDQNDGLDISLLLLNRKQNIGQWAGANTPLIQIHSKDGILKEIRADKRPIGDYPDMKHFTNHQFTLTKGDKFYLFSDGYSDQFGGADGKKYMKKKFKNDLLEISKMDMNDQKKVISENLQNWMQANGNELEQVDDITIFGIEI